MLPRRPAGFLCSGNLVFDILVRPVEGVAWGVTNWVESIEQTLGGNGSNTSYALAKLGAPVRLAGYVGRDGFADAILPMLQAAGVDLSAIRRSDAPTASTVVLVNPSGARAFLHRPGCSTDAFSEPLEFTRILIGGASHYHLANPFSLPQMRSNAAENLRRARAAGLTTSCDAGWDSRGEWLRIIEPCLPHLDILFVNEDESRMLSGFERPEEAAAFFREHGVRDVVVKLGGQGCAVFTAEIAARVPGFPVEAVDTTGAGDSFTGGYLAALFYGASDLEAARFANAVGALSARRLGSVTGLLSRDETVAWMAGRT